MDQQPVFKTTVFGGFERRSVLNYIFEINNNAKTAQDSLNAQLEEVSAARERLSEALCSLENQLQSSERARESLNRELSGEKAKNSELNSMLDSLNQEIDRQKKIIEEKDAEIKRYGQLKDELEQKNAVLEEKCQEVEKASIYVGDMVMRARLDADKIIEDAGVQAEMVLDDAKGQARNLVEEAAKSLSEVFDQFGKFRAEMESIEDKIEDAVLTMQKKFAAIGETIAKSEDNIRNFYRPYNISLLTETPSDGEDQPGQDGNFFRPAAE